MLSCIIVSAAPVVKPTPWRIISFFSALCCLYWQGFVWATVLLSTKFNVHSVACCCHLVCARNWLGSRMVGLFSLHAEERNQLVLQFSDPSAVSHLRLWYLSYYLCSTVLITEWWQTVYLLYKWLSSFSTTDVNLCSINDSLCML